MNRVMLRALCGLIRNMLKEDAGRRAPMPAMQPLEGRVLLAAVGVADYYVVNENQVGTPNTLHAASVLLNDTGATSAVLASNPAYAAFFEFRPDGTFTYTPASGYDGLDSFTYRASDGSSPSDPVTVTIKVNNMPLALSKDYNYQGGTGPVQFHVRDFAVDKDDTEFIFIPPLHDWHLQGPLHGTVALSADKQTFTYTPYPHHTGSDSFQFRVNDGHISSNEGTIRLLNIVSPVSVVAYNDFYEIAAGTTLHLPAPFLLMNDRNNAGAGALSVASFTQSEQGTVQVNADGSLSFTPNPGFSGNATFTYRATNGESISEPATVLIHLSGAAQVAAGDYYFVLPGQTINISGPGVLANDVYSGTAPTVAQEKGASQGSLSLRADGGFTYTAPANPTEPYTFFRYQHGSGGSADRIATVYLIFAAPSTAIQGTAGDDAFHLATEAGTGDLLVWHNQPSTGPATHRFGPGTLLKIFGQGGNDTLTIDLASPIAGSIEFHGGDGANRLVLANPPAGGSLAVNEGSVQFNSANVGLAGVGTIELASASGAMDLASLTLSAGARLTLPENEAAVLRTPSLSIGNGATLDLRKASLIVQPAAGADSPFASVLSLVASARNGTELWNGAGITTSSDHLMHGLYAFLNEHEGAVLLASLGGMPLDTRSVVVLYTLHGDCNGDRVVDARDYLLMDHGFLSGTGNAPQRGDLDYNGQTDGDDYYLADRAFMLQGIAAPAAATPAMAAAAAPATKPSAESSPTAGDAVPAAIFSAQPITWPVPVDEAGDAEEPGVDELLDTEKAIL